MIFIEYQNKLLKNYVNVSRYYEIDYFINYKLSYLIFIKFLVYQIILKQIFS